MAPTQLPHEGVPTRQARTWSAVAIALAKIIDDGSNPRKDMGEQDGSFAALVESIRDRGVLQPPMLRPINHSEETSYLIVMGHRRIAAARALGWEYISCTLMDTDPSEGPCDYTDEDRLIDALVENLQRKGLNCIETAEGIHRLEKLGRTQEQIARLIGRTQGRVSRLVRLTELPEGVKTLLRAGSLSQTHGEEMISLIGSGLMSGEIEAIAHKAVQGKQSSDFLGNVVKARLSRMQREVPKTLPIEGLADTTPEPQLFAPNNSTETADEIDDRIARTLKATKELERQQLPSSMDKAPKETNNLTRKESDAQFAAAMAPDPDVLPLSERPSPEIPAVGSLYLCIDPEASSVLQALSRVEPYQGKELASIVAALILRRAKELDVVMAPTVIQPSWSDDLPEMAVEAPESGYWNDRATFEVSPDQFDQFANLYMADKISLNSFTGKWCADKVFEWKGCMWTCTSHGSSSECGSAELWRIQPISDPHAQAVLKALPPKVSRRGYHGVVLGRQDRKGEMLTEEFVIIGPPICCRYAKPQEPPAETVATIEDEDNDPPAYFADVSMGPGYDVAFTTFYKAAVASKLWRPQTEMNSMAACQRLANFLLRGLASDKPEVTTIRWTIATDAIPLYQKHLDSDPATRGEWKGIAVDAPPVHAGLFGEDE